MSPEDRIKLLIGELHARIAVLESQNEALERQNRDLKSRGAEGSEKQPQDPAGGGQARAPQESQNGASAPTE